MMKGSSLLPCSSLPLFRLLVIGLVLLLLSSSVSVVVSTEETNNPDSTTTEESSTMNNNDSSSQLVQPQPQKILVVGATGNTGKHVVSMLLDQGHSVSVIARSKDKLLTVLPQPVSTKVQEEERLTVIEASLLDLTQEELKTYTSHVDAVVSCLGHTMDFQGLWGSPKRLVRDAVQELTMAMPDTSKFILMGSDGVSHPDGKTDPIPRSSMEKFVLFLLRNLIQPHADNEEAAAYLYQNRELVQHWVVVRPTDLIDSDHVTEYETFPSPISSLFGGGRTATRINVATFIVDLILNESLFDQWNQQMPVIYDKLTTKEEEEL